MLSFTIYALQVVICSAIMMLYYWLVLRNKRFHSYNRFYILSVFILSWLIPLGKIYLFDGTEKSIPKILYAVASGNDYMDEVVVHSGFHVNWWMMAKIAYVVICLIFVAVFVKAIVVIYKIKRDNPKEFIHNFWLVLTNVAGTPFSFFKYIFWNNEIDINSLTGKQMLEHELVHVNEKHSVDAMLMQIVLCVGWFNPFFWLAKNELNVIHEFIADKKSVENGDTAAFAAMLLAAAYPQQQHLLTQSFFFSPIKRRLLMLTQNKNPKFSYMRRIVILPLLAAVVLLFAFRIKHEEKIKAEKQNNISISVKLDTIPQKAIFILDGKEVDESDFKDLSPNKIDRIDILKGDSAIIKYGQKGKNGVVEIFTKKDSVIIPRTFLAVGGNEYKVKNATGLPISLTVFNKWGNVVYQKENYYNDWGGTGNKAEFDGKELEEGTYYVLVSTNKNKFVSFISLQRRAAIPARRDTLFLMDPNDNKQKAITDSIAIIDKGGNIIKVDVEGMKEKNGVRSIPLSDTITTLTIISGDSKKVRFPQEYINFLDRNKEIEKVIWRHNPLTIIMQMKDGTKEEYNLENEARKQKAIERYGDLPAAPPPPPPTFARTIGPTKNEQEEYNKVFTQVQTPPSFPGGKTAWQKYLERNLNSDLPVKKGAPAGKYTVVVSFIIDKNGNISDVKSENDPGYGTAAEALRVIKKGPAWVPAVQNGQKVTCRHRQSITFMISDK